ncbi:MAG: response regulator transcription factor [Synoicihabitans sp.]
MTAPLAKILIIEDDPSIREAITAALEMDGYAAFSAEDGPAGLGKALEGNYDLILLDLMLPGMSGYDVCRSIRRDDPDTPIIMVTAKSEEIDKVLGLELGADDYITKPFGIRELLARVHVALRRVNRAQQTSPRSVAEEQSDRFDFAHAVIDRKRFTARRGDEEVSLSARELHLIECFEAHQGEVLSRESLLNTVWGMEYLGTTRTLDQHVAQVRKKVEDTEKPRTIKTIHGIGYQYLG